MNPDADDFYKHWDSIEMLPIRYAVRWKELRHWISVVGPAAGTIVHIDPEREGVVV